MKISLPRLFLIFTICLFSACATRSGHVVTMDSYLEVQNGATREQILQKFGEPVSIEANTDGSEVYTYIERFSMNGEVMESRTYHFYLKNGVVIGKTARVIDRPQTIDSDQL